MNKRIEEVKENFVREETCGQTKPNHVSYNLEWSYETIVNFKKHDLISTTKQTHTQCCEPSLGLTTKLKEKQWKQIGNDVKALNDSNMFPMWVGSVWKCKGRTPNTPK